MQYLIKNPNKFHNLLKPRPAFRKAFSRIFALFAMLIVLAGNAEAGTVTINSNNGAFSAVITITATSLNKTANGTANFNYTVNLNYSISFTGTVPSGFSFYNLAGTINDNDGQTGFQLPNAGGSGMTATYSQTHPNFFDYATATPSSVGATQALITLSGPDISASNVPVSITATAPLPVRLEAFSATATSKGIHLAWRTAQETQTRDFTVERSSDGKEWDAIKTIAAEGSSAAGASYEYTDALAGAGLNYYRLAETDQSGSIIYSAVAEARTMLNTTAPKLFPNPNSSNIIHLSGLDDEGDWKLAVIETGAQFNSIVSVGNGQAILPEMTSGLYFLRLYNSTGKSYTIRYSKL